jgi:hypothetical protein
MISIFIGTLYSGEAEFEQHTLALRNQVGIKIYHHVIKDLSEYEAHRKLWNDWEKLSKNFQLFIKIDSDTVLIRETALLEISKLFENPNVTGCQIKLLDYFSNSLIAGINAYSPIVKFTKKPKRLFPDLVDLNNNLVLRGLDTEHLEPIAFHCINPNNRQSFTYGYHRMLKKQNDLMKLVAENWLIYNDDARMWALLGAQLAKKHSLQKWFYKSEYVNKIYSKQQSVNVNSIRKFAEKLLAN